MRLTVTDASGNVDAVFADAQLQRVKYTTALHGGDALLRARIGVPFTEAARYVTPGNEAGAGALTHTLTLTNNDGDVVWAGRVVRAAWDESTRSEALTLTGAGWWSATRNTPVLSSAGTRSALTELQRVMPSAPLLSTGTVEFPTTTLTFVGALMDYPQAHILNLPMTTLAGEALWATVTRDRVLHVTTEVPGASTFDVSNDAISRLTLVSDNTLRVRSAAVANSGGVTLGSFGSGSERLLIPATRVTGQDTRVAERATLQGAYASSRRMALTGRVQRRVSSAYQDTHVSTIHAGDYLLLRRIDRSADPIPAVHTVYFTEYDSDGDVLTAWAGAPLREAF